MPGHEVSRVGFEIRDHVTVPDQAAQRTAGLAEFGIACLYRSLAMDAPGTICLESQTNKLGEQLRAPGPPSEEVLGKLQEVRARYDEPMATA